MVTIYGLSKSQIDKIYEVGFLDELYSRDDELFDVAISEEVRVIYHFGDLSLNDGFNTITFDQLDFVKVVIK